MPDYTGSRVAVDSSLVVAALTGTHPHHEVASDLLVPAFGADQLLLHTRVLTECYSVMTRLPTSDRLSPQRASTLLAKNFQGQATIIDSDGDEHWATLDHMAQKQIAGGAIYDGEIALAAARAGASYLLTLNVRHFVRVAPIGLEIVGPALA